MAEAKVYISGPIVADSSEAGNAYPYCTLEDVTMQLDWQKPFDSVRVVINSPGGRVDKGLGIYDVLRALGGVDITTVAVGQCSSIATAIFLAGSQRLIHQHTEALVHLPSGSCQGTAEQVQAYADEMARCQQQLIDLYVERTGVDAALITAKMAAETVLTAEEMLSLGFATQVVQPISALATLGPQTATPTTDETTPAWAQPLMSKITIALAALAAVMPGAKKPATATAPPKMALAVTLAGGDATPMTIAAGDRNEYAVGDAVYTDADMAAVAADGSYPLTDGNTITVAAGAITAIAPTETTDTSATASAETNDVLVQVLDAVTNLAGQMQELRTAQTAQAARLNQVASAVKSGGKVALDDNAETKSGTATGGKQEGEEKTAAQAAAEKIQARQKQNRRL